MADAPRISEPAPERAGMKALGSRSTQAGCCWCHPPQQRLLPGWALVDGATSWGRQRDPGSRARMLSPSPHKSNQLLTVRQYVERSSLK